MVNNLDKYKQKSLAISDTMGFKIETEDKKAFMKFCKKHDLKTGMVIRDLIETFMEENK